jgi:hypothetical protein
MKPEYNAVLRLNLNALDDADARAHINIVLNSIPYQILKKYDITPDIKEVFKNKPPRKVRI